MDLFPLPTHTPMERFPHISGLLYAFVSPEYQMFLSCLDIYRVIGLSHSKNTLKRKLRKHNNIIHKSPNQCWNGTQQKWESINNNMNTHPMVAFGDIKDFLLTSTQRMRKGKQEKLALYSQFNIDLSPKEDCNLTIPIEHAVLDILIAICPYQIQTQYRLGSRRIDAYLPKLQIAIEIDEHGHESYNKEEERAYNQILREHNIMLIRFIPDDKRPTKSGFDLVRQVWEKTISPDFVHFTTRAQAGIS